MIGADFLKRINKSQTLAPLLYIFLVIFFIICIIMSASGLNDAYAEYSAAATRLAAFEGHKESNDRSAGGDAIPASPFLQGPTVTIAGADLQRRVVEAVTAVSGNVLSSQIDLQGSEASKGYVVLSASCEISQTALQPLLYDLEGGMPYLFIEQIVVQSPQSGDEPEGKRMRVQINVAGEWQVAK